jgi:hypothetical protein
MTGLDTFRTHFESYTDCYIVIGGAACDDYFEREGIPFRATRDIDMVLVVEAMNDAFITHFWNFIKKGRYERNELSDKRQYYRFINPENNDFPVQVELFCRKPDLITQSKGGRFTIIPANEDISSLSAILMDDDYYRYILDNRTTVGSLTRANELALICLKAKAFLDLSKRKKDGQRIDTKTINKHRSDIFRLAATLSGEIRSDLPESIRKDIYDFVRIMEADPPQTRDLLRVIGITNLGTGQLLDQLKLSFMLE